MFASVFEFPGVFKFPFAFKFSLALKFSFFEFEFSAGASTCIPGRRGAAISITGGR